jgi:hypothetical protein
MRSEEIAPAMTSIDPAARSRSIAARRCAGAR